jgi:hypothetical protein
MKISASVARRNFLLISLSLVITEVSAQPIDFTRCPDCSSDEIALIVKVNRDYQGINGFNPSAPSTYRLIGNRKFSGSIYPVANPFVGENWYPIRTDKQILTGTFHDFGISNWGDESDWNIHLLPAPNFEGFIADALPYQNGGWPADEEGHFLIEAEITPDEHRYGNPWFNNNNSSSTLLHRLVSVYGPFVREEAHGNHPEIHPSEQIWWKEADGSYMILLVNDDSNRFKRRADSIIIVNGQPTMRRGDYTARRVTTFDYQPWTAEKKQESELQVAFELNPATDGYYVSIQALDQFNFFSQAAFPDVREGSKYSLTYNGNLVLTVEESSQIDPFVGVSFKNVCFNRAKGILQGYIVFNTAVGNGDGKEGFVALRIDKQSVGVNAKPQIMTGDIANTWKPFAPYDDRIPFSDIISSDMNGKGIVDRIIDFNGNGKSDLFAKSGDRWMVLFDGKGPWQQLQISSIDVSELRFGDVNGNGKTDILRVGPNHKVLVSFDGIGSWTQLTDAGEQNNLIQVADFNGDHVTDLVYFKTKVVFVGSNQPPQLRGDMFVKYSGAGSWKVINHNYNLSGPSDYADNFRFGNFNNDDIADVFRFYNKKFNVYWNGRGDIKQLTNPNISLRTSDLLFATGLSGTKNTDVVYVNPVSKQWTVFYAGLPGSLPLTVTHGDPATIRFADIDGDAATDLVAIDFVRGNPNTVPFPTHERALIEPSMQMKYVDGSLKRQTINGIEGLYYDQDVLYYPGNKSNRRSRAADFQVDNIKDRSTSRIYSFAPAENFTATGDDLVRLGRVTGIPVKADGNTLQVAFKTNAEIMNKSVPATAIAALSGNVQTVSTASTDWESWQPYLNSIAKPNKKVLVPNAPGKTFDIKKVDFELLPMYSGMEGKTARMIEMEEYIEELNDAIYNTDLSKKKTLFGDAEVFNISWNFVLTNLNTGAILSSTPTVKDGRFKKSKVSFSFPTSSDLMLMTATATIRDKYGLTNKEPVSFDFYNKEIRLADSTNGIRQWVTPYLAAPSRDGFVWMGDHWERQRAREQYLTNAQFLQKAYYLAEDKVLTVAEMKTLLGNY